MADSILLALVLDTSDLLMSPWQFMQLARYRAFPSKDPGAKKVALEREEIFPASSSQRKNT